MVRILYQRFWLAQKRNYNGDYRYRVCASLCGLSDFEDEGLVSRAAMDNPIKATMNTLY